MYFLVFSTGQEHHIIAKSEDPKELKNLITLEDSPIRGETSNYFLRDCIFPWEKMCSKEFYIGQLEEDSAMDQYYIIPSEALGYQAEEDDEEQLLQLKFPLPSLLQQELSKFAV